MVRLQDFYDFGSLFHDEIEFSIADWETPKTTRFFTSEERDDMCAKCLGLCEAKAVGFVASNPNYSLDDLRSFAHEGLAEALNNYDPRARKNDKPAQFTTYAYRCVTNSIIRNLKRTNSRISNEVSLDTVMSEDSNGHVERLESSIADPEPSIQDMVAKQQVIELLQREMMTYLDPTDYYILTSVTGAFDTKRMNQHEVASVLKMSQANVCKRLAHAENAMNLIMRTKYPDLIESLVL